MESEFNPSQRKRKEQLERERIDQALRILETIDVEIFTSTECERIRDLFAKCLKKELNDLDRTI